MQIEYTLQASEIRGISLQFDTFQTLNHDKGEREIRQLGFIFFVSVVESLKYLSFSMSQSWFLKYISLSMLWYVPLMS